MALSLKVFSLFYTFLSEEVETIFWERKAKPFKFLKSKVYHLKRFRKLFWRSSCVQNQMFWEKRIFSLLTNFLTDDVEAVLRESEAKLWELPSPKVCQSNYFRKWFWRYFEAKNECPECSKIPFSGKVKQRLQRTFYGKARQRLQKCLHQKFFIISIPENSVDASVRPKWMFWTFENATVLFLKTFRLMKLKLFSVKAKR